MATAQITKDELTKRVAAAMIARDTAKKHLGKDKRVTAEKQSAYLNFQKVDKSLSADGFYGPNVRAALTWYLQKAKDPSVPPEASKYAHIKVTWTPPVLASESNKADTASVAVSTHAPAPSPAPAPASKPATISAKVDTKKKKTKLKKTKKSKAIVTAAKKVLKTPEYGQELHTIKPKHDAEETIAARAKGQKPKKSKAHDAEDLIAAAAKKVNSANGKQLKAIRKHLLRRGVSAQATSEHKALNKRDDFQRKVLTQLATIQKKISGKQATATGDRRIVGLVI